MTRPHEPIAIVGVGLRLPRSDDLDGFWRHLAAGRSLISEVPAARWDKAALHGDPATGERTASIWGGFLEDADRFDAPFFGISPREAAWMDPQQRFALEMAWQAIEDAGYRAGELAGSRTGVFLGVCHWDYAELIEKHLARLDAYTPTGIAFSILANRISHFFDFSGPSIVNDTACAASLTSLYEAVSALRAGDCELALAGGVNLIWSLNHFVAFSKAGMLSKSGRSRAFDAAADGYVRGEGGAMLLLKPLARAEADGDPIHGVIRGVGVNHGGRTNSLTVTSPRAQAELVAEVCRGAGVTPDRIDYVEAHGTGTPLGDPIEIAGLKQAFATLAEESGRPAAPGSVGVGSVKTNLGHLEGAAGVVGLVKVLAALRHGLLPANLGFEAPNRLIELEGSPFRIQAEATPWPRGERPRLAGVSSFGFGGSNAHALVEEAPAAAAGKPARGRVLLPLSARDPQRLSAYAERLAGFLEQAPDPLSLADLAWTFQVGREAFEARAAFVVDDGRSLLAALRAFLAGAAHEGLWLPGGGREPGEDRLAQAALAWLAGEPVDWRALQGRRRPRRLHAPTYPFARLRYWYDETLGGKDPEGVPHPLLHRNLSGFEGARFRSRLADTAWVWAEHRVGGAQVLPGVAALEMARAALELAGGAAAGEGLVFEELLWRRPVRAGEAPAVLETRLERQADGAVAFEIAGDGTLATQGRLRPGAPEAAAAPDLAALRAGATETLDPAECYRRLRESGVEHGPSFRILKSLRRGSGHVLAELKLGRGLQGTLRELPLHPIVLDAAIQAWAALDEAAPGGAAVPFACRRLEVYGRCEATMTAWVRRAAGAAAEGAQGAGVVRLDIDLFDSGGSLRVAFRDLALRVVARAEALEAVPLERVGEPAPAPASPPTVQLAGDWRPAPAGAGPERDTAVLLAGFPRGLAEASAAESGLPVERLVREAGLDAAGQAAEWFAEVHGRLAQALRERPKRPLQVLVVAAAGEAALLAAPLAGLFRTASAENPRLSGAVVELEGAVDAARLARLLAAEHRRGDAFAELRYDAEDRRLAWRPVPLAEAAPAPKPAPDGAYWIAGGLGGLGLLFAEWLAGQGARRLVLSGRRAEPSAAARERLARLERDGVSVALRACDLADGAAVAATAAWIAREVGPLRGVIHAAGLLDDGFILTKDPAGLGRVLAPKVAGALHLDAATRDAPLDFLLLCSSVAATFGNPGQGDYAGANAFLDAFAERRARQVAAGERRGASVAVAWPLWAEGGMGVDAAGLAALRRRFGTEPLPTQAGLQALGRALAPGAPPRQVVLHGAREAIEALVEGYGRAPEAAPAPEPAAAALPGDDGALRARTLDFLKELLAERVQMDAAELRGDRKLEEYGLDSIVVVEMTTALEERLGPLSKTLFFEFVDLDGIAGHLLEEHRDALERLLGAAPGREAPAAAPPEASTAAPPPRAAGGERRRPSGGEGEADRHDIAIVGLSLRVAGAADQEAFWRLLSEGLDGFEAVPAERWNHGALLHPERDVLGKTVVRSGAFLDDVDRFDPRYFRISQYEAELMSPEVRLFLEASVEAFEDAGYSREYLQSRYDGEVAVIVGSMTNEYDLYGFQNMLLRGSLASGSYTGTLPNMVSYFYGFTGPSYFLDTMCSAASTCVHEAVHMLRAGRCGMALAGGVSLLLHPQKLIATSQEHFTSKTAEVIRGYGLGADGTILGEGVGALVLKPLADAERDGDHVYGVITGSGISNAGVRNGFTVPSPGQQAVAVERALEDAGISPRTIGYLEGHGSGTALGDPIEVKALTQAWSRYTDERQFCPLGTVKSNVAHLLGASGLAGIAKVLMQLKHGELAPSLHAETLNPNIPFERTPFYVQRERAPWPRPADEAGRALPRRAGVTSIGAGGMNSHIIIEEHLAAPRAAAAPEPQLLVLSALDEAALLRHAARLADWLERHPDLPLADLAYTLQVGRNALPCRLAFVADDLSAAARRLREFAAKPGPGATWRYSRSILEKQTAADPGGLARDLAARDLERLATAWADGAALDWDRLWGERLAGPARPRRLSLPAYPFERVRCWYPEDPEAPSVVRPLGQRLKLHPLVGANESDLAGLRYATPIHLDELRDYAFARRRELALLPTAAVEAALALGRIAGLEGPLALSGLKVRQAVDWPAVARLRAAVEPEADGRLRVLVGTEDADGAAAPWLEARVGRRAQGAGPGGVLDVGGPDVYGPDVDGLDVDGLEAAATARLDHAAFHAGLAELGLEFGPYLEVVERAARLPGGGLLCALRSDHPQQDFFKRRVQVPPRALAAAFQALALSDPAGADASLAEVERAELLDEVDGGAEIAWLLLEPAGEARWSLRCLDAAGRVRSAWQGLRAAAPDATLATPAVAAEPAAARAAAPAAEGTAALALELRALAAGLLKFPAEQLATRALFYELGFDSISLTRFAAEIGERYGLALSPSVFFECEHLEALAAHLAARHGVAAEAPPPEPAPAGAVRRAAPLAAGAAGVSEPASARPAAAGEAPADAVAVIGLAGRFPGADDPEAFFERLLAGADLTGPLPLERYGAGYRARLERANFARRGGFLADVDRFDAAFFRISPVEAERLDPQQRLLLETVWRTLEEAGYRPDELPEDTGVFVGVTGQDYAALLRDHGVARDGYGATGNSLAMAANRISHFLDLHGPSEAIDTACSSSLVALLRAAEAVRGGRCGAALVGGVNLCLAAEGFEGPAQAGMLSPEGRCKSFGAGADGYARGEGVIALMIKRLDAAERDGDRILGLLVGGAENHGGRAGALTAPSAKAQAELVVRAMQGLDPASIGYLEAHGTGTSLGDPVEVAGLRLAYERLAGAGFAALPPIGLGTVKSNVGHLEAAAGLAGVVKALLALRAGELPPSLHCATPNPHLELAGTPFRLVRERQPWPCRRDGEGRELPRRAGVSSFGFGGSNAHVVLQEHRPRQEPRRRALPPRRFAETRFWIPGVEREAREAREAADELVLLAPRWREAALAAGEAGEAGPTDRLVVAAGVELPAVPGAELLRPDLPAGDAGRRYGVLAEALVARLQRFLREPGGKPLLVQLLVPAEGEDALLAGLGALLDSAAAESLRIQGQVVAVDGSVAAAGLPRLLQAEAEGPRDRRVRYRDGRREVRGWAELPAEGRADGWRPGGVFLITGGLGGLGRLVARDIAGRAPGATLVLAGRSPPGAGGEAFLGELRGLGATAEYWPLDLSDGGGVEAAVRDLVARHGALHGVVHCAGVLRDGWLPAKTPEQLASVLAPKVTGTLALERACRGLPLERFVLFSSLAGAVGNPGQACYAAANGFLGALAERRGAPFVALDWPLWAEGGMTVDAETERALFERMGQRPLASEAGLSALRRILAGDEREVAVVAGEAPRIRAFFEAAARADAAPATGGGAAREDSALLRDRTLDRLRGLFAEVSGLSPASLDPRAPLEDYGIDSLMITRLNRALGEAFGGLSKTLLFEHRTLAAVAGHLAATQEAACRRWAGLGAAPAAAAPAPPDAAAPSAVPAPPAAGSEPIAIVGLSGRYPGAQDLEAFWEALAAGRDLVGEIPAERWSLEGFFHPDPEQAVARGLSYAKWGGFLEGFADFDPLAFKIAPRDAAAMDPQERLFLAAAWEACEDAGYSRTRLARQHGSRVGVFAGVTKTGWALHGPFRIEGGAQVRPTTSFAGVANRVSHVLDLKGPSLPVDTMCSSSLTAIHEACEALRAGDCELALAGGVNLYLHPATYQELSAARMLSPDGRCRSFGAGGKGFVPGEGVGCLLLKPLSRALADGDRIHALIRATAVNHGGHTNGYTVPNPAAQAELVRTALARAGIEPAAVTCLEAHGTGTELGDPIEVSGLLEAFGETGAAGTCALGSVKSNIGHLEAAAGIAGLTKVVLQMRHGTLVPTLHAETANPNLALEGTPFRLQRSLAPWTAERRIAGVSSFGAGGANAHVVLEAWPAPAVSRSAPAAPDGAEAILLSARDPERLRAQAERLLAWLERREEGPAGAQPDLLEALRGKLAELLAVAPEELDPDESFDACGVDAAQRLALRGWLEGELGLAVDPVAFRHLDTLRALAEALPAASPAAPARPALADIAWTLQVGREAMDCRLALEVASHEELAAGLRAFLAGREHPGLRLGRAGAQDEALAPLLQDEDMAELAGRWLARGRLGKLLELWVRGLEVDWSALPRARRPQAVSLPTYAFARRRFWLPEAPGQAAARAAAAVVEAAAGGAAGLAAENAALEQAIAPLLAALLLELPDGEPASGLARWRAAADALLARVPEQRAPDSAAAWAAWAAFKAGLPADSGLPARVALAEAALRALPDVLTGRRAATSALFPEGSMALVEGVYKDNPTAARFSRRLAEAAAAFVARRRAADPARGLRILEIGAGTGGTSEAVFEALAPHGEAVAEYRYTDLSRAFLIQAERRYGERLPWLATAIFDVERPLEDQEVEAGGYDLVIAANVLHATADMERTLATVAATLAPGGLLLLNETSEATLFTHLTFGLLDGWWRFSDSERRIPGSPSLSAESWRSLLEQGGFRGIALSPEAERALGQQLVAALAPATAAPVSTPRPAVPEPASAPPPGAAGDRSLRDLLLRLVGETLNVPPAGVEAGRSFADYGLDSILGMELVRRLREALAIDFDQTRLFDFSSVAQLEKHLAEAHPEAVATLGRTAPQPAHPVERPVPAPALPAARARGPIAIVGASGRFAGSPDLDALWAHLEAGDDLVEPVTRFDLDGLYRDAPAGSYGRHGSFVEGVDLFDPTFFGISGLEATYMDPQQRLFLEEAFKTLENAGHAGPGLSGRRCGVFVGCSHGDYQELFREQPPGQAFWGNTISLVPARIAYWLDLKGPAVAVDTACSSSLVALHLACQAIRNGECEMALAGGVFLQATTRFYRYANQARMLSPSGRCAAFGAGADGIVPGEGVGAVLLRPLDEALAEGDRILGVVVASGTNQDGATNGITAPSAASQERLIEQVYSDFGIEAASLGLVEAHGTGTPLGDPIEFAALKRAFGRATDRRGFCALGSVKSNLGHATTAAGVAGLLKVLLALRHRRIPPTLHATTPNPAIGTDDSAFYLPAEARDWPAEAGRPRRAAISSFGFSGTNAHVVVEEAPALPEREAAPAGQLVVLSAASAGQLRRQAERLLARLARVPEADCADLAFTLLAGRRPLHHRLALVVRDSAELVARLGAWLAGERSDAVRLAELDARDQREDAALAATGRELLRRLATERDPEVRRAGLEELAGCWLAGCALPWSELFPAGTARRIELPSYPFEAKRYWVETVEAGPVEPVPAPAAVPPQPARADAPVRLADPASLVGPFAADGELPSVALPPLAPAVAVAAPATLRRRDEIEGVRHLELAGAWSPGLAAELASALAEAGADETVRVVLLSGRDGWAGEASAGTALGAVRDCPLPVVAALGGPATGGGLAAALEADFLVLAEEAGYGAGAGFPQASRALLERRLAGGGVGAELARLGVQAAPAGEAAAAGLALARQVAEAPRLSLVELKRHLRREPPDAERASSAALLEAAGAAASAGGGPGRRIPLDSPVVELEAFEDGVALVRLCERAGRNCFTPAFMAGITEAFEAIRRTAGLKVVVLTGHDSYFACGGTREGLTDLQRGATRFTDLRIYSLPLDCELPVIAAMQGHGIGAGWSLGLYCDLALVAAEGVYHSNYLWFGFTPGAGATLVFPQRLGDELGREVLFTAREYRGRELAARLPGLAALPASEVLPRSLGIAHALAGRPRDWLVEAKATAAAPLRARLEATLAGEVAMHEKTFIGSERVRARIAEAFPEAPPAPAAAAAAPGAGGVREDVRARLVASLAEELMIEPSAVRESASFLDLGLDSILAVTWLRRLNGLFGLSLPATAVYAHPTVGALVDHVAGALPAEEQAPAAAGPAPVPARGPAPGPGSSPALTPASTPGPAPADAAARREPVRAQLVASLAEELMIEASAVRDSSSFLDLGLDSILAVTWLRRLNGQFGIALPATAVYAHPTVGALVDQVASLLPEQAPAASGPAAPAAGGPAPAIEPAPPPAPAVARGGGSRSDAVAIVGASGRFPKAGDLEAFWDNIRAGRDCIEEVPPERWDVARWYHPDPQHPGTSYGKWMGRLEGVELFDPLFFRISPREAELTDPQQRLFLEDAWHAIEDAGLDPTALAGTACGIFVGAGPSGYENLIEERNAYSLLGKSGSILAARIAHLLDLRGPCLSIDTACSSSLVAIAEACNSLLLGDSDLALAGGACVLIGPSMFVDTSKVNMLSRDGRCFTWDRRANGFVPGEGVGVVLLKRLEDAERDGDPIRAVIRGWGVNQDGKTNGITAPNPQAQTRLLRRVYERFGIDPAGIGLIEAHGTGTALGDPIEIEGLRGAFAGCDAAPGSVALGSVKSNVGHLLASAGIAGALKAMLALERRELPPTINFEQLNEHIRLEDTPFVVNSELRRWQAAEGAPRRAGVSSFGFSGTNAHLVLEEYPQPAPAPSERGAGAGQAGPWLFALSARNRERLADYAARLHAFVEARPGLDLGDLAWTLQVGRTAFDTRLSFVFSGRDGLLRALASAAEGRGGEGVHFALRDPEAVASFESDAGARALAARWLAAGEAEQLGRLARLWACGLDLDFSAAPPRRRLRLPGYPFARQRHWATPEEVPAAPAAPAAHPLLPASGEAGSLRVEGDEPWLTWHATSEERLPLGLFLPELARLALERELGAPVRGLRHLVWGAPLGVNGHARELRVVAGRDGAGAFYRIVGDDAGAPWQLGEALDEAAAAALALPRLDPRELRRGVEVGPAFRRFAERCAAHSGPPAAEAAQVVEVRRDGDALVALLSRRPGPAAMLFDPLLLDPVWRLLSFRAGLEQGGEDDGPLLFPYALEALVASGPLPDELWLRIAGREPDEAGVEALSVCLHDAEGHARLLLDGLLVRPREALEEIRLDEEVTL